MRTSNSCDNEKSSWLEDQPVCISRTARSQHSLWHNLQVLRLGFRYKHIVHYAWSFALILYVTTQYKTQDDQTFFMFEKNCCLSFAISQTITKFVRLLCANWVGNKPQLNSKLSLIQPWRHVAWISNTFTILSHMQAKSQQEGNIEVVTSVNVHKCKIQTTWTLLGSLREEKKGKDQTMMIRLCDRWLMR